MKVKNKNNSSIKTEKLIKKTFAELLMEKKELDKITIKELTRRADINRGTFYLHYDSIYDVASDFEEEILNTLNLDDIKMDTINDVYNYFDKVTSYLKENENIYKMLLSSNEPIIFLRKLSKIIKEKVYNNYVSIVKDLDKKESKFVISFFIDGIISQVLRYYTNDALYTLDDINSYMKKYFKKIIIDFINK